MICTLWTLPYQLVLNILELHQTTLGKVQWHQDDRRVTPKGLQMALEQLTHPKYHRDIDGLRAIAILSVVGFHAAPGRLSGGFICVDIFFVISGYLITTIIIRNLERESFNFVEFYRRRIRRIFPALALVLLTCLIFGSILLTPEEYKNLGKHIAGGAGFSASK